MKQYAFGGAVLLHLFAESETFKVYKGSFYSWSPSKLIINTWLSQEFGEGMHFDLTLREGLKVLFSKTISGEMFGFFFGTVIQMIASGICLAQGTSVDSIHGREVLRSWIGEVLSWLNSGQESSQPLGFSEDVTRAIIVAAEDIDGSITLSEAGKVLGRSGFFITAEHLEYVCGSLIREGLFNMCDFEIEGGDLLDSDSLGVLRGYLEGFKEVLPKIGDDGWQASDTQRLQSSIIGILDLAIDLFDRVLGELPLVYSAMARGAFALFGNPKSILLELRSEISEKGLFTKLGISVVEFRDILEEQRAVDYARPAGEQYPIEPLRRVMEQFDRYISAERARAQEVSSAEGEGAHVIRLRQSRGKAIGITSH